MRVKDDVKQEALFEATVKLVNEIGFASSSVSKIAKQAQISPATIYVYYKNSHSGHFHFTEQFANSPFNELVDKEEVEKYFEPLIEVILHGIEQKIIKDVNFDILMAFMFYPIMILSNERLCRNVDLNENTVSTAFNLAWDAIRK